MSEIFLVISDKWPKFFSEKKKKKEVSNAIGSSRESNPSRRVCNLLAVQLRHVADWYDAEMINKGNVTYHVTFHGKFA